MGCSASKWLVLGMPQRAQGARGTRLQLHRFCLFFFFFWGGKEPKISMVSDPPRFRGVWLKPTRQGGVLVVNNPGVSGHLLPLGTLRKLLKLAARHRLAVFTEDCRPASLGPDPCFWLQGGWVGWGEVVIIGFCFGDMSFKASFGAILRATIAVGEKCHAWRSLLANVHLMGRAGTWMGGHFSAPLKIISRASQWPLLFGH